ncbi:hypothetical protein GCM10027186_20760 [Micromonospora schwarzwaldensis]
MALPARSAYPSVSLPLAERPSPLVNAEMTNQSVTAKVNPNKKLLQIDAHIFTAVPAVSMFTVGPTCGTFHRPVPPWGRFPHTGGTTCAKSQWVCSGFR